MKKRGNSGNYCLKRIAICVIITLKMRLKTSCKIISLGNYAFSAKGNLKIHSRFNNVINLVDERNLLISVVTKQIGNGPNNIVVDHINGLDFDNISITKEHIIFDDEMIPLNDIVLYDDKIVFDNFSIVTFKKSLQYAKDLLKEKAHPLSAVFLLGASREKNFKDGFQYALMNGLKKGMDELIRSNFTNGKELCGMGIGLTPTGDDLIDGALLALSLFESIGIVKTSSVKKTLYESIGSTNIISRTFLYYSYLGRFYEKFKDLIIAMSNGDRLNEAFYNYLDIGETSGADILTGFIITIEKLLDLED